ncbi:unnamed protein product [Symbiodinium necroappetens]|uniref:Uncharacterized protein n=1 Tax=Symbiodinium necroappetens TaxID=1628268 RepID=A0A812IVN1_9DINO|nr:unnamed protein product [Symbiodinium necroappetens]
MGRQGEVSIDAGIQDVRCDSAKHIVDIINNVPPPDKTAIETAINSGHWGKDRLPEPVCLKSEMEVNPQDNGNISVLRHMYSPDVKLTKACLESLCYGTPYVLKWQGHAQNFRKGFQWFLQQLGGWQCRQYALTHMLPCHQPRQDSSKGGSYMSNLSEKAVDKGFAFIEEEAGRLGTEWKGVQWTTKNLNTNSESPIYARPQALVERSLRALQTDGVLALPIEDFHFTLADVEYSILDFRCSSHAQEHEDALKRLHWQQPSSTSSGVKLVERFRRCGMYCNDEGTVGSGKIRSRTNAFVRMQRLRLYAVAGEAPAYPCGMHISHETRRLLGRHQADVPEGHCHRPGHSFTQKESQSGNSQGGGPGGAPARCCGFGFAGEASISWFAHGRHGRRRHSRRGA